jgi:ribosomal protein S18 acetylase RimI-like enzyme
VKAKAVHLHSKEEIEAFLRRNVFLHLYELGDLDGFFWPYTTWYALKEGPAIRELALLYTGSDLPVLLAFSDDPRSRMPDLLRSIAHLLPRRLYAHLTPALAGGLEDEFRLESHGTHLKMALADRSRLKRVDTSDVVSLSAADLDEVKVLYGVSYPGNWFDPRMLETGQYYGIRRDRDLVSVAGIHVYSPLYRIAALGNITTLPELRGQGLGTRVTAKTCQSLFGSVDHIGLNVKADNASAIASYRALGFERVADYEEFMLECRGAWMDRQHKRESD